MSNIIELKNITTGYSKESPFINKLNFNVEKGVISTIIGSNGAGKTTLLKSITGLLPLFEGSIHFEGEDISNAKNSHRALQGIGYVPQGRFIFPFLSVEENLLLGVETRKQDKQKAKNLAYDLFPDLAPIANRKGGMLSGGQQQQLAIARILVLNPKLLILDEPSEGIQPNIVKQIGVIIKNINKEMGISIILVEQFVEFAINHANHFYFMESGEVEDKKIITASNKDELIKSVRL